MLVVSLAWLLPGMQLQAESQVPRPCRGYNIGIRLIDEFLAKSKTGRCIDFRDTADKIAKVCRDVPCAECRRCDVRLAGMQYGHVGLEQTTVHRRALREGP